MGVLFPYNYQYNKKSFGKKAYGCTKTKLISLFQSYIIELSMESYRIKEDVPMPQFSVSLDKVVEKLRLEVVYTPTELKNIPIYTADVNRPGLLLTGYDEYFDQLTFLIRR